MKDNSQSSTTDAEPDLRLTWRLKRVGSQLQVCPYVQSVAKAGGWTKGRRCRLGNVLSDRSLWTTRFDESFCRWVKQVTDPYDLWEGATELELVEACEKLRGHPHIYWEVEPETRVRIERARVTLRLEEVEEDGVDEEDGIEQAAASTGETDGGEAHHGARNSGDRPRRGGRNGAAIQSGVRTQASVQAEVESPDRPGSDTADRSEDERSQGKTFTLRVCLGGTPLDREQTAHVISGSGCADAAISGGRIRFAAFDRQTSLLVSHVVRTEPRFPPEAHGEILTRLEQLEKLLPLELPEFLLGETVEPDNRVYVRLGLSEEGELSVSLRTRPLADGPNLLPGEGSPAVSAWQDGKRVRTRRALGVEAELANECVNEFFSGIREGADERWTWFVDDRDQALDLVGRLQDLSRDKVVVEWATDATRVVRKSVGPGALRVEIQDQRDWFGLSGGVDIDGHRVSLGALLGGLKKSGRYVRVGDHLWMQISDKLRKHLDSIADVAEQRGEKLRIDRTSAPLLESVFDEAGALKASKKWLELSAKLRRASELDPQVPETVRAELRDYQVDGFRWLSRLSEWEVGGCLADDMGLGKTLQTLAVLTRRQAEGPALVVAPTSVGFNWISETERFAPGLKTHLYREAADRDDLVEAVGAGDVVVVSYGLLRRDAARLSRRPWASLVLDEAQNVKNSRSQTARAARTIEADWRLALTGTPLENHLGELWSIFQTISPGLFGSWERFRRNFAEPIERYGNEDRRRALVTVLQPFILRRTKGEVLAELPERTDVRLAAELSADERRLYEDARLAALAHLTNVVESDDEDGRFHVLAALTRLRQLACHPALVHDGYSGSSAKMDLLVKIVEELRDGGHRALVFSQFTQHLGLVRDELTRHKISFLYLDGATSAVQRAKRVKRFQDGEGDLFLISLKAGGTGLNLTGADYVIHLDPWWNPAIEDQASDRAHRIGQTRPVTVYRLVAEGTIEEEILALHEKKRDLFAGVLDGSDRAGRLSTGELIDLIRRGGASEVRGKSGKNGRKKTAEPPSSRKAIDAPRRQSQRKSSRGGRIVRRTPSAVDDGGASWEDRLAAFPQYLARSSKSKGTIEVYTKALDAVPERLRTYAAADVLEVVAGAGPDVTAADLTVSQQRILRSALGGVREFLRGEGDLDDNDDRRIREQLKGWSILS